MSTTTNINYQFIPSPRVIKTKMREEKLKGNYYIVMDFLIDEIFSFPDTRNNLQKHFSYRFVAEALGVNFGNIGRILKKLQAKGFISILEKGKDKIGSLIKINLQNFMSCTSTTEKEKLVVPVQQNKEANFKEKYNNPVEVALSPKLNLSNEVKKEDILSSSLLLEIQKDKAPVNNESHENIESLEFTKAPENSQDLHIHGVKNKVLYKGIKKLKERGITEIEKAVNVIRGIIESKGSKIMSKAAYYMTLCTDIDINEPVPSALDISPVAPGRIISAAPISPERKTVAPSALKTQEYLQAIEEEKTQGESPEEILQALMKSDPDGIYEVIKHIDKTNRFVTLPEIKFSLYVAEYRKRRSNPLKTVSV